MNNTFLKMAFAGLFLSVSGFANSTLITKDYATAGDGLLTVDTIAQNEWLDVSIFVGMNFNLLQGANQWTSDGFRLATDDELYALYINAGSTWVRDGTGTLNFGTAHSSGSVVAVADLYSKLGGGTANFGGNSQIHGILADDNNNGLSNLGRLRTSSSQTDLNFNGDQWGGTNGIQTHGAVGAFFVRNVTDVPEPSTLAILGLGLMGLAARRFKKHA